MRSGRLVLGSALLLLAIPSLASTHARRGPTSQHFSSRHAAKAASKPVARRAIDDTRATEIQGALVSAGYLSGQASGHWDDETEAAMQKFQGDNGWQTKLIPDSRAIIKLGLGPRNTREDDPTPTHQNASTSSFLH